jgi:type III secretion system low calcium response chaperone LcrH/SycD
MNLHEQQVTQPTVSLKPMEDYGTALDYLHAHFDNLPGAARLRDSDCEMVYAQGCKFFQRNRYQQASERFSFLVMYRPLEPRYLRANAVCQKLLKNYEAAATLFFVNMTCDPGNPEPALQLAQCLFCLKNEQAARDALDMVELLCRDEPEHAEIRERAKTWKNMAGQST